MQTLLTFPARFPPLLGRRIVTPPPVLSQGQVSGPEFLPYAAIIGPERLFSPAGLIVPILRWKADSPALLEVIPLCYVSAGVLTRTVSAQYPPLFGGTDCCVVCSPVHQFVVLLERSSSPSLLFQIPILSHLLPGNLLIGLAFRRPLNVRLF